MDRGRKKQREGEIGRETEKESGRGEMGREGGERWGERGGKEEKEGREREGEVRKRYYAHIHVDPIITV